MTSSTQLIEGREVQVTGKFVKILRLRSEHHVLIDDPRRFAEAVKRSGLRVDIVTFVQAIDSSAPEYGFHWEPERLAVLRITTYDDWFNNVLYVKPRNMLRKALKSGIDVQLIEFSHSLLIGIKDVYDEVPIRQGKPNRHYGKDLKTLELEHSTFLDRSQFIAVYLAGEMIGFAKVTFSQGCGIVMNFLSKVRHRDKATNNAILAKVVEICAERSIRLLVYGHCGGGGTHGLDQFKASNGFESVTIPRYFVPLTPLGRLALRAGLHRELKHLFPKRVIEAAADVRNWWNTSRVPRDLNSRKA
jgi:hypothetical protein